MKKLAAVALVAFAGIAHAWKEPAWTRSNAERAEHSTVVFVAIVESVSDTPLRALDDYPLRKASVRVDKIQKSNELLNRQPLEVFFYKPRSPGPDRGWVSLAVGQRAVFYARARSLKAGKPVLFLDFQSDVQAP